MKTGPLQHSCKLKLRWLSFASHLNSLSYRPRTRIVFVTNNSNFKSTLRLLLVEFQNNCGTRKTTASNIGDDLWWDKHTHSYCTFTCAYNTLSAIKSLHVSGKADRLADSLKKRCDIDESFLRVCKHEVLGVTFLYFTGIMKDRN